jgi:hypothetical protein
LGRLEWAARGKRERGEGKGFLSFFLNSFQIIFKLSNFSQTRNHAFESWCTITHYF